jgi:hypothetical protein
MVSAVVCATVWKRTVAPSVPVPLTLKVEVASWLLLLLLSPKVSVNRPV